MFRLIGLGVAVAYLFSVVAVLVPGLRSRRRSRRTDSSPLYFEAAAIITTLVLLGQVLELRARAQHLERGARAARPRAEHRARVDADGTERDVPLDRGAARRPAARAAGREDPGRRRRGRGRIGVDESMITGEPLPVEKTAGDQRHRRHARTRPARFLMRAEKVGADTLLAQIAHMVGEAQRSARADPAARRSSCRRCSFPAVIAVAVLAVRRLGARRAGAAAAQRAGHRGVGADHRVPVRARARDADLGHGRHRPRRARRRADQGRRGARDHGEGRHAGGRQDRHAHRGQAGAAARGRGAGLRRGRTARARREPRAGERASARGGDRRRRAGARASRSRR